MRGIVIALLFCLLSLSLHDTSSAERGLRDRAELHCLALNIYFEARGESIRGQIAVGQVTLNRLKHALFPGTICGVVLQPFQFSWVNQIPKWYKTKVPEETIILASNIIDGKYKDESRGALYFHAREAEPFQRREVLRIGNHIFYR